MNPTPLHPFIFHTNSWGGVQSKKNGMAVGVVEGGLCWVTMSRVVLNRSGDEGRETTVLCRRASSVDVVATSVVGHLFRGCVRTGAVR